MNFNSVNEMYDSAMDFLCEELCEMTENDLDMAYSSKSFFLMAAAMYKFVASTKAYLNGELAELEQLEKGAEKHEAIIVSLPIFSQEQKFVQSPAWLKIKEHLASQESSGLANKVAAVKQRKETVIAKKPNRVTFSQVKSAPPEPRLLVRRHRGSVDRLCAFCGSEFNAPNMSNGYNYCCAECKIASTHIFNRMEIFARDNHTCVYCGASPFKDDNVVLHVDHIIPVSKAGSSFAENLVTSCSQCNLSKSNSELKDEIRRAVLDTVRQRNTKTGIDPKKRFAGMER